MSMTMLLQLAYVALWLCLLPGRLWRRWRGLPQSAVVGRALGLVEPRASERPCIWLQGEGLGELTVLLALLPHLEQEHPDADLVVVTATSSGYDLARQRLTHRVLFCPFDLPRSIANLLDRIRPSAIVVVERAEHPRLIAAAQARGIPLTLVNARFLNREHRGQLPRAAVQQMVRRYEAVLAQSTGDAQLFAACGVSAARLSVGGAIKFDNAQFDRGNPATQRLARLAGIGSEDAVLLAGSTRGSEDEIIIRVFAALVAEFPRLKLVIVPRHARRFAAAADYLHAHGIPFVHRSELGEDQSDQRHRAGGPRAILVDVFGELPAWWGLANIGFVGNSLARHGGQNMIEPAAYGVATCFGPHTENFQDVVALLLRAAGGVVVDSEPSLQAFVRRCLEEPEYARELGRRAQRAVAGQRGALARTEQHLTEFLRGIGHAQPRVLAMGPAASERPWRAAS
jgi:3-deoxy-D-manno-octulosonic-acid transferase